MSRRRSAFTLVELLVVIGIIAVLVGILMPALSAARRQARTLKCLANLRSIGQAFVIYAANNQRYYPIARHQEPDVGAITLEQRWHDRIALYVSSVVKDAAITGVSDSVVLRETK